MLDRLRQHPVSMVARFEHVLSLTYAAPKGVVSKLLPAGVHADTIGGNAYLAVAVVQVREMRPHGCPAWVGGSYVLAGCRVFVRLRDATGRTRRGLWVIQSESDRLAMVIGGNLLTHYNYALAEVRLVEGPGFLDVQMVCGRDRGRLHVIADIRRGASAQLPVESPFEDMRQAARYAGPLPYTFDGGVRAGEVVAIKGVRDHWRPRMVPVRVEDNTLFRSGVLDEVFHEAEPILASAFHVSGVSYCWQRGQLITLAGVD